MNATSWHILLGLFVLCYDFQRMHLYTELSAASWMLEPFGEVSTRGDQKVRGKVLLYHIAFIDCNEN